MNSVIDPAIGRMVSVSGCVSGVLTQYVLQECPNDGTGQSKRTKSFGDKPNAASGDGCFKCGQTGHWSNGRSIITGLRPGIHQKWMVQLVLIPVEPHSLVHPLQTLKALNEAGEVLVPEGGEVASGDEVVVRRRIIPSVLQTIFDIPLRFEPLVHHCTLSTLFSVCPFHIR